MRPRARDIKRWAEQPDARGELPRLVRRLVMQAATITQITLPAGESINRPGRDGEILSEAGDPWVPAGRSFRELSVEGDPTKKANSDYEKRTAETPDEIRREASFVALRVASILARLSQIQLPDNRINQPLNSLLDIFRAWWPQLSPGSLATLAVIRGFSAKWS